MPVCQKLSFTWPSKGLSSILQMRNWDERGIITWPCPLGCKHCSWVLQVLSLPLTELQQNNQSCRNLSAGPSLCLVTTQGQGLGYGLEGRGQGMGGESILDTGNEKRERKESTVGVSGTVLSASRKCASGSSLTCCPEDPQAAFWGPGFSPGQKLGGRASQTGSSQAALSWRPPGTLPGAGGF